MKQDEAPGRICARIIAGMAGEKTG